MVQVEIGIGEVLQGIGWGLTVLGQVQIGRKLRRSFLSWIVANLVLIAVSIQAGLWVSVGMYATNIVLCVWSFAKWSADPSGPAALVNNRKGL
ncbi:nicotinamide mononucleotide transporter [Piscinibacter gummiphilus]|jgi:hypothetical protein|uniref:Nicotinamide mononucleotide transporter n=1 Tax=Piscinibacter gummiphilus TaxID=946333 RepID=A0ABZ0D3C9_9BURK|nr:nicotinamide mononucleotide transporter [Piscinibacter gummiphilus]WOB11301.1 nicotinamide mononucleotide transporter [Piscinibacter gummiphilus]